MHIEAEQIHSINYSSFSSPHPTLSGRCSSNSLWRIHDRPTPEVNAGYVTGPSLSTKIPGSIVASGAMCQSPITQPDVYVVPGFSGTSLSLKLILWVGEFQASDICTVHGVL